MIVLIDNYDSFTFNLFHYLGGLGADVVVHRNDKIALDEVMGLDPDAIVLSPGPCTPNDAGICLSLIDEAAATVPILGVCLGHQAIGQAFGGDVVRAPVPIHGKLSEIKHQGEGVFHGINAPFKATRYHSLVVDARNLSGGPQSDGRDRRQTGHGACASHAGGARRAVPSRKHRVRAWPSYPAKFPRHRGGVEPLDGPAAGRSRRDAARALRGECDR